MSAPNQWRHARHARPVSHVPILLILLGISFLMATSAIFAAQHWIPQAEQITQEAGR